MGASERRSVGRGNLPQRRASRPTGGVSVGASERLSVGSGAMRIPSPNEGAQGCPAVDSSCGGRRGGVVARRRCAARRGVCFFSPRHAQSATARRVRVRVALVVDRVVAMRFASLARSSATAPVSSLRSLPRVVVRSVAFLLWSTISSSPGVYTRIVQTFTTSTFYCCPPCNSHSRRRILSNLDVESARRVFFRR